MGYVQIASDNAGLVKDKDSKDSTNNKESKNSETNVKQKNKEACIPNACPTIGAAVHNP